MANQPEHGVLSDPEQGRQQGSPNMQSSSPTEVGSVTGSRQEEKPQEPVPWEKDPQNPINWPAWRKTHLVFMVSSFGFVASAATSIISPAAREFQKDFGVSRSVSFLPLSLYVWALGFGPVLGGPLSESLGRRPVYIGTIILGSLFTLGVGFTSNFGALCFLRFAAGFCWSPALAIGSGSIAETFLARTRGPIMALYILMPFLGPAFGPILGSYAVSRQSWRWTQWILLFFAVFTLILVLTGSETYHSTIKRRLAKQRGVKSDPPPPFLSRIALFLRVGLIRPVHMLFTEPIMGFMYLYVAVNVGILFSFFAAVPYTFGGIYHFSVEQTGLVFLSVAIGCGLGYLTLVVCDFTLYRPQAPNFPPQRIPPEYRLYPALISSVGLPLGLFWYAWTARASISWASPAAAIIPFSWGNLCIFVSASQYLSDTYHPSIVASNASANALARYTFAGAFPLFIIKMFESQGLDWALSLFAFVTVALVAVPWVFFKFGPRIRVLSSYKTIQYE